MSLWPDYNPISGHQHSCRAMAVRQAVSWWMLNILLRTEHSGVLRASVKSGAQRTPSSANDTAARLSR